MKYKKYLLYLLLFSIFNCFSINKIYAEENNCTNMSESELKKVTYGKAFLYNINSNGPAVRYYNLETASSNKKSGDVLLKFTKAEICKNVQVYGATTDINQYYYSSDDKNYILVVKYIQNTGKEEYYWEKKNNIEYTEQDDENYQSTNNSSNYYDEGYSNPNNQSEYCYYTSDDLAVKINYNKNNPKKSVFLVDKWGLHYYNSNNEKALNWNKKFSLYDNYIPAQEYEIPSYTGKKCPDFIVVTRDSAQFTRQLHAYAFDNSNFQTGKSNIEKWCKTLFDSGLYCYTYYAEYKPNMTDEEYRTFLYGSLDQTIVVGKDDKSSCSDIFGSINDSGSITYANEKDKYGNKIILKEDPPSLGYMIHQALSIARTIAIVLVIVLGILDFAKSVLAGKEDEMRKNQQKFVKRLIACVVIFLVPTIVSIIMNLIDETETLNVECMEETKEIIK